MDENVEYLHKLRAMIKEKGLEQFFTMADNASIKPMNVSSFAALKKHFVDNAGRYAGRKVASITLYTDLDGIKTDEDVFVIKILISEISDTGKINQNYDDNWGLKINYKLKDLKIMKFTLKMLHKLVTLTGKRILEGDPLNGMSLPNFLKRLKSKGINLDTYEP